jgi:hypothetical protein
MNVTEPDDPSPKLMDDAITIRRLVTRCGPPTPVLASRRPKEVTVALVQEQDQ